MANGAKQPGGCNGRDEGDGEDGGLAALASLINHELRNPLAGIRNYQYMLARSPTIAADADCARWVAGIGELMQQMNDLLAAVSEFSRSSSIPIQVTETDLNELLNAAAEAVRAEHPDHPLTVQINGPLPVVCCDPAMMRSVFEKLLSNAAAYNRNTEPRVRVGCECDGDMFRFHLADDGVGITAEMLPKVMAPFTRLPGAAEFGPGLGLGLPIARTLVRRHGGELWLESKPDAGTTVYFTLPEKPRPEGGAI